MTVEGTRTTYECDNSVDANIRGVSIIEDVIDVEMHDEKHVWWWVGGEICAAKLLVVGVDVGRVVVLAHEPGYLEDTLLLARRSHHVVKCSVAVADLDKVGVLECHFAIDDCFHEGANGRFLVGADDGFLAWRNDSFDLVVCASYHIVWFEGGDSAMVHSELLLLLIVDSWQAAAL